MLGAVILFVVAMAFAWNLGVHYTGAVMGMPYAARAIALRPALLLIGAMTILGATFASGGVEETVGRHLIADRAVTLPDAIVIVLAAGGLTLFYNYLKIPTSTIQILVFCIIGTGLAAHIAIHWATLGALAIVWVAAPLVAFGLGFVFTRLLDLVVPPAVARAQAEAQLGVGPTVAASKAGSGALARAFPGIALSEHPPATVVAAAHSIRRSGTAMLLALRLLPALLVAVGVFASFVLGANDVSNATGVFIMTHQFSTLVAGLLGGLAMAVGTLTWGRRILQTVAFDIVKMDLTMASAAQGVQGLVVLAAVSQGFFTSMNQALIGAMAGTGLARGRETVRRAQLLAILRGWLIGPLSGVVLAFVLDTLARLMVR